MSKHTNQPGPAATSQQPLAMIGKALPYKLSFGVTVGSVAGEGLVKTLTVLLQVYELYISHLSFCISWLVVKGCLFACFCPAMGLTPFSQKQFLLS